MGFKEIIKNGFKDEESTIFLRYKASKIIFTFICFMFFLSFFFIGSGFYEQFFLNIFIFLYFILIISLDILIYLFFRNNYKGKFNVFYIILFLFFIFIFSILLLFPVLTEGGITGFYNDYIKVFTEKF